MSQEMREPIGGWKKPDMSDRSLAGWADIILGKPKPSWTCPDCGAQYYAVAPLRFCPACRDKEMEAKNHYELDRLNEYRGIANDILARILNK